MNPIADCIKYCNIAGLTLFDMQHRKSAAPPGFCRPPALMVIGIITAGLGTQQQGALLGQQTVGLKHQLMPNIAPTSISPA